MKRHITYPGALPRSADFLGAQQDAMIALGFLMSGVFGLNTVVDGVDIAPTAPASMSVVSQGGFIVTLSPIEATPFGSLPQDTADYVPKMGYQVGWTTIGPITAPATPGQSQCWLVQAQLVEVDSGLTVLPYFNAANPNQAYSGPGNLGTSQYTVRDQQMSFGLKGGVPATTGTQQWPGADPGWVPLAIVTIAYGQTQITAGNIQQHPLAPIIPQRLPQMRSGFSNLLAWSVAGTWAWTTPIGVTRAKLSVTGGGGGGCGATPSGSLYLSGAGGGAGGTSIGVVNLTPGQIFSVTVGQSGAGGAAANGNGTSGGTSSFGTLMSATGGQGGTWGASGGTSSAGGSPGTGIGGLINLLGGSGRDGQQSGVVKDGSGGSSFWGGSARSGAAISSNANGSGAPGTGGGGNYEAAGFGLNGQPGLVVLEY